MKVYKQTCALCGVNDPEILFPATYKGKAIKGENIVICKHCGLVYKYPIIPESEIIHYMNACHWNDAYYNIKLEHTADFVSKNVQLEEGTIIDIGAAAGHLLNHLSKRYPKASLIGIEPSKNACKEATDRNNKLRMLATTIEDVNLSENSIDLITAISVDYLFFDHVASLVKINKLLSENGKLYIERNVFLDSKAFVSRAIRVRGDLFGANTMMHNWFTKDQMALHLSKYFEIITENTIVSNVIHGHKNIHYGWLCKKKTGYIKIDIPNSYKVNKKYVLSIPQK